MHRALSAVSLVLCTLLLLPALTFARPELSRQGRDLLERLEQNMRETASSPLQGAWVGRRGQDELVLVFMHNVCAMGMNSQELYGLWRTRGHSLQLRLEKDKVLDFHYELSGNTLVLDHDIRLVRYTGKSQERAPIPGFGDQGQRSRDTGFDDFARAAKTPLEGSWVSPTAQGDARFVFHGNKYQFFLKGRKIESGDFSFRNNILSYHITGGTGVGRNGEHRALIRDNTLIISSPNGETMQFMRQ